MSFCVYCGTALTDPNRCGECGAYKVESTWHQAAAPTVAVAATETGWRPDPTGRHEGRYFVAGQPTDLIRDGNTEAVDPLGKQQLDQAGAVNISQSAVSAPSHPGRRRLWWVLAAVVLVLGLVGAGVGVTLFLNRDRETVDDKYLAALRQSGLSGEFNSDANAVAHGKQVCRQLEDGAPQQGMPVDQVAVDYYCPQFTEGFHVLETATVAGSFTLRDDSPNMYAPAITVSGSSCSGSGGYSDIDEGTQVTVKNGKGDILTTTVLESGEGPIPVHLQVLVRYHRGRRPLRRVGESSRRHELLVRRPQGRRGVPRPGLIRRDARLRRIGFPGQRLRLAPWPTTTAPPRAARSPTP